MMTDNELLSRLSTLSKSQAEAECEIIAYLIEVERRSLHLKKAYRSLFEFVFNFLKCSEATASRRVAVARAAMKFPAIVDMIRTQQVTLTSLALVAPHLTQENHEDLLRKVCGASKRETEKLTAQFSTAKPKRDVIRPIVVDVPETLRTGETLSQRMGETDFGGETLILNSMVVGEEKIDTVRIAFDAPARLAEKIERLKEIHAHKFKDGSLAEVLEMAVDKLLDKTAPERQAGKKNLSKKTSPDQKQTKVNETTNVNALTQNVGMQARRPPAAIQREVWKRDEGRCTFTDHEGKRCSARSRLQIDHVQPWALGGSSKDLDNLRLLCQVHNLFVAEKFFPAKRERRRQIH